MCPVCPAGTTKTGGRCGQPGGTGGNGGDWGQPGQSTAGENTGGTGDIHDGGKGGTAICGTKPGTNTKSYSVSGTITTTTLKGLYETGGCDGTQAEEPDIPPPTISFQTPQYVRFSYPEATHLMVTAPDGIGVSFRLRYDYDDRLGTWGHHLDKLSLRRPDTGTEIAFWSSLRIDGIVKRPGSALTIAQNLAYGEPGTTWHSLYGVFAEHPNILLGAGEYPLVWDYNAWTILIGASAPSVGIYPDYGLHPKNTLNGTGSAPHANSPAKCFNVNGGSEFKYGKSLYLEDDGMDTSEYNGLFRLGTVQTSDPADLNIFEEYPDAQLTWNIGGNFNTVTATSSPNDPTFSFPANQISGTVSVKPTATTTYTITAIGPGGSTSKSVTCLLYTSPSPRDRTRSRMPSSA